MFRVIQAWASLLLSWLVCQIIIWWRINTHSLTLEIIEVFNFQITSHLIWRDAQSALTYRLFIGKLPHFSVKHGSLAAVSESVRHILRTAKWWMSKPKEDFNMKNCRVVYNWTHAWHIRAGQRFSKSLLRQGGYGGLQSAADTESEGTLCSSPELCGLSDVALHYLFTSLFYNKTNPDWMC